MVIEGRYKKKYEKGKKINAFVKEVKTVFDSGGTYHIITTTDGVVIEDWKLDRYIIKFNIPDKKLIQWLVRKLLF